MAAQGAASDGVPTSSDAQGDFVAPNWKRVASKRLAPGFYYYRHIVTGEACWDLNEVYAKSQAEATTNAPNRRELELEEELDDQAARELAGRVLVFARGLIDNYSPPSRATTTTTTTLSMKDLSVFSLPPRGQGSVSDFSLGHSFSLDDSSEPSVGLRSYIERIVVYTELPEECFYVAMAYVTRLCRAMVLSPTTRNFYKIVLTGVLLAGKFLVDARFSNGFFAQVGGVTTSELNALEYNFLRLLRWQLNLTDEEFQQIHKLMDR